jgi:hypothetical protein
MGRGWLFTLTALGLAAGCQKEEAPAPPAAPAGGSAAGAPSSPAPASHPMKDAYFGDLHLHTSYSFDAFTLRTNTTPEDSYRYALAEEVDYLATKQRRRTPLDFLAVTDHAEYLGVLRQTTDPNGPFAKSEWFALLSSKDPKVSGETFGRIIASLKPGGGIPEFADPKLVAESWKRVIDAAESYDQPGKLTTFVGFEWTAAPREGVKPQNLRRCVIFKGANVPGQPYSTLDSEDPEDLWTYLENARRTGSDVLAIPHNGNASNGLMFDTKTLSGEPLTREYALRRMANEPATEIIQGKGQSDTHPKLSPEDEFANFELWETLVGYPAPADLMTGSYIRQSMGVGQELQERLGQNPFKYGIVAGTDYHSGISSTEEDNYPGSHGNQDDDPRAVLTAYESISGEPPVTSPVAARAPRFAVWALKDPNAGNLDRIQIIKMSTKDGESVERIYDVVWSGDRQRDPKTGRVPPVGNTVDMQTATYANSIGATELSGVWEDPDFDPSALATYYVRALEIPTPRWSFIWAIRNHLPPNQKMALVIQERAWSSPIWYAPAR